MQQFPKTLHAVEAAERDLWAIGDAVLKECGPPGEDERNNGRAGKVREAVAYLAERGYDYSPRTLTDYADAAYHFPLPSRHGSVGFTLHLKAGDPEILTLLQAQAKRDGVRLTQDYVERLAPALRRDRDRQAQEAQRAEAKQEEAEASEQEEAAMQEEEAAETEAARERARQKVEKAKAKQKAAKAKAKAPPAKRPYQPKEEELNVLARWGEVTKAITDARRAAKVAGKALTVVLDDLTDTQRRSGVAQVDSLLHEWEAVQGRLKGRGKRLALA